MQRKENILNTKLKQIKKSSTALRSGPSINFPLETECLYGEAIKIIKFKNKFVYCECIIDNYKGWILFSDTENFRNKTHKVITLRSFVQKYPDIKSNVILELPFGSQISAKSFVNNWVEIIIQDNILGFIPLKHIIKIEKNIDDWIEIAEQFINTPYKWGGRNSKGIDCSALVQLSLQSAGIFFPRDSKDQVKMNWKNINDISMLNRGMLVFWKGHVGVMIDHKNLLHANASSMSVKIEDIGVVMKRHEKDSVGSIIKIMTYNKS